jgi:hypothetical protein
MEDATLIAAPNHSFPNHQLSRRRPAHVMRGRRRGALQAPPGWRRRHNRDCSVESLDLDSAPSIVPLDLPAPTPSSAALPELHFNIFYDLYGTPIT